MQCGKSATSRGSEGTQASIRCSTDCQIAKRNAKLADALGISPDMQNKALATVTYNDEIVAFARANAKFLPIVEKAFGECVADICGVILDLADLLVCLAGLSSLKSELKSFHICLQKGANLSTT